MRKPTAFEESRECLFRSPLTVALALLLAACATPLSLKPGTSIEEARSTLGRPTAEVRLPDGGTRLQFRASPTTSPW